MALKPPLPVRAGRATFKIVFALLFAILSLLFFKSYLPGWTVFSNDGPLGALMSLCHRMPDQITGAWQDLNVFGYREGGALPSLTYALMWLLGPIGYSKFYAPVALLVLGLGAWCFFRQLRLAPLACVLGGMAAMLNSGFFSAACWGIAAHPIAIGMSFFALAAIVDTSPGRPWLKALVAGMALGIGVADGADIGAIFSVYVAGFAIYQALVVQGPGLKSAVAGIGRLAVVAGFAGLVAAQAVSVLIGTQIKGIAGTEQDSRSKQERWDFATQWSLPKAEALGILVPGVFGYRMDTPKDMGAFGSWFEGGIYWGEVGRDPAWDRYFSGGKQGAAPNAILRFTGGGNYAGILVVLLAIWGAAQALRRENSVFSPIQRRYLWFWIAVCIGSLLLAFGRYAPFYQLLYAFPYVSTIRNPAKFTHVVNWSLVVLFAYGVHGLSRRYLDVPAGVLAGLGAHLKGWWAKVNAFDRKWTIGSAMAVAAGLLGWLIYASSTSSLQAHLPEVGFGDPAVAAKIAAFSVREFTLFLPFLILAVVLVTLVLSGWFAGQRARVAGILLGLLLVVDLGRANLPWVIYWDYAQKYATNPVIEILRDRPYEHRVAILPRWIPSAFKLPPQLLEAEQYLDQQYVSEWAQHHFLYYNIQSLDPVQMPRKPADLDTFDRALQFRGTQESLYLIPRMWQLTNVRYVFAAANLLPLVNRLDGDQGRFRIASRFDIVPKPEIIRPTRLEELTAVDSTNGTFALIEFTAALPRAELYLNWELCAADPAALTTLKGLGEADLARLKSLGTNDFLTLIKLASPSFDPAKTVLLADPLPIANPAAPTNQTPGTVEFTSYAPKRIVLRAKATAPSVLLLNDKFDPNWQMSLDGKPEKVLRCNFIMRGVQVPAGEHTIEFRFAPPINGLYISLLAIIVGLGVAGFLAFSKPAAEQASEPLIQKPAATKKPA